MNANKNFNRDGRLKSKPCHTSNHNPSHYTLAVSASVFFLMLLCGCQTLTYVGPNGERFSRRSFGASTALSLLQVEAETNGVRRVELRGYRNDSGQVLSAITEAAIRAAISSAK